MTEQQIASKMQAVGCAIAKEIPGVGFFVLAFPINGSPDARGQYVTNGNREDIIKVMKEFIARQPMQRPEVN